MSPQPVDEYYDYSSSGLDSFLSRSIDNLSQVNLDAGGPRSTQFRFDSAQSSGGFGDTLKLGAIEMRSKDSTIQLNSGVIQVNDEDTGLSALLSGGKTSYQGYGGNTVIEEGVFDQGESGFRLIDDKGNTVLRLGSKAEFTGLAFNDTTNDRIFIGKDSSGNYKAKLSQAGYDVKVATNDQLVWSSDFNLFKIVSSGTATVTIPTPFTSNTTVTSSIAHGLTSKPSFIAFVDIPLGDASTIIQGKLNTVPASAIVKSGASAGLTSVQVSADVDASNLNLRVTNTFGANLTGLDGSWVFRYYILQETATT